MRRFLVPVPVVLLLVGGLVLLPRVTGWMDRGCNFPSAVVYGITRGEPGTFEFCVAPERDDFESDFGSETTPTTAATTTTEDPEVVAAREAREAEAERREAEHQARIDECWAQAEAELNTWTDAYNAWLDSTGGQGDYAAWEAEHPEPASPTCGEL